MAQSAVLTTLFRMNRQVDGTDFPPLTFHLTFHPMAMTFLPESSIRFPSWE